MDKKISSIKIAIIISTLFVPPSFTILLVTYFTIKFETELLTKILAISTAFTFGFIFHIIYFIKLRNQGNISDNEASIKEERDSSYLVGLLIYTIGFVILIIIKTNIITIAYWFSYIPVILSAFVINKKWKISAHALWSAGALAALAFVTGLTGFLFLPLLIAIGWCRLKLKLHSLSQVLAGYLLGFLITYFEMYLIINYLNLKY